MTELEKIEKRTERNEDGHEIIDVTISMPRGDGKLPKYKKSTDIRYFTEHNLTLAEKKYYTEYYGVSIEFLSQQVLNDPDLPNLKSIVLGFWDGEIYGLCPETFLNMIIKNKEKFQHIEGLFIGDMEYTENECSWINQTNYEGLLNALPNLKSLRIRGSLQLDLGTIDHQGLEEIEIITGGLHVGVVNSLKAANLPNLQKLALWLGVEDYGYDCQISDFAELAKKERFPKLKYLGFMNFDVAIQADLISVILESDLLPQLEVIDVSCGTIINKGGQLILDAAESGKLSHIKKLVASHHYMTSDFVTKLEALPFEVDVSDGQGLSDEELLENYALLESTDEDDRWEADIFPMITE